MTQQYKVTCAKCGYVFEVREVSPACHSDGVDIHTDSECPNCPKLTYGSLTEEMVAEALHEAGRAATPNDCPVDPIYFVPSGRTQKWCLGEARFVLRLLSWRDGHNPYGCCESYCQDALLDLARKP